MSQVGVGRVSVLCCRRSLLVAVGCCCCCHRCCQPLVLFPVFGGLRGAVTVPCPGRARTLQGMARLRSGQARAWPLVPDRRGCRGSGAQGHLKIVSATAVRNDLQVPLTVEGRPRTLSGPSPDLCEGREMVTSSYQLLSCGLAEFPAAAPGLGV